MDLRMFGYKRTPLQHTLVYIRNDQNQMTLVLTSIHPESQMSFRYKIVCDVKL